MGGLHRGHGALIQKAAEAGPVLVSVFVNPLQFGPAEDYGRYPRTLSADLQLAEGCGASALWAPAVESIYPPGQDTTQGATLTPERHPNTTLAAP